MRKYVLILALITALNANAQSATSGNCGPKDENGAYTSSCTWSYDETTHTLNFTGDGYMAYGFGADKDTTADRWRTEAPWRDLDSKIEYVNVGGNLKNIGGCSVYSFVNLKDMTITAPIESFGQEVFGSLKNFEIPATVKTIGAMGLAYTKSDILIIPDSVETIDNWAFEFAHATGIVLGNSVESIGANAFFGTNENMTIFCEDTSLNRCHDLINEKNSEYVDKIKTFTKDESGFYQIGDKLYATADLMTKDAPCDNAQNCRDILDAAAQGKRFKVGGKYYMSLNDYLNGNDIPLKRIYTVEEAEKVSKKTGNTFRIRYK
ncbi:MAG: leucine-rich repeat domain-containing protein [Alphaproteobacteria bacterium]|nr:leucine-rich repeat domain-containing protein [Alphaproteobacteria bacterium]